MRLPGQSILQGHPQSQFDRGRTAADKPNLLAVSLGSCVPVEKSTDQIAQFGHDRREITPPITATIERFQAGPNLGIGRGPNGTLKPAKVGFALCVDPRFTARLGWNQPRRLGGLGL
jgi:hypothetical protein